MARHSTETPRQPSATARSSVAGAGSSALSQHATAGARRRMVARLVGSNADMTAF
jgi:hypothetical protein